MFRTDREKTTLPGELLDVIPLNTQFHVNFLTYNTLMCLLYQEFIKFLIFFITPNHGQHMRCR